MTYKKAGVDILKASLFKEKISALLKKSYSQLVLKGIGGFGSLFRFPKDKYKEPVLVSSSDGVGTKIKIAVLANKHDTVGIDLVAMNVNDILCLGAKPLFFLDYIAYNKLSQQTLFEIVKGINEGCLQAECSLIGGETAQMPDVYKEGEYDLAGFCVGVVEKNRIINGSKIEVGDLVIGLESNGLHSNGFSLVRKVFSQKELRRMSGELLKPTRIYVRPILDLLESRDYEIKNTIKGIAHITGGAFYEKVKRILPDNLNIRINKGRWNIPKIFKLIQNKADIDEREMYWTFNMGIGMILVVAPGIEEVIIKKLQGFNLKAWVIGEVIRGKKEIEII
ncbi:MAG: phosphoribosylformylglycinamidine cyclo-ligase [Candidatus Omnitrophica bacterium]|nr:phosphoribosylformylglycinamidine cyclo-ligase [Candidatus Omnitrophota bacterium]